MPLPPLPLPLPTGAYDYAALSPLRCLRHCALPICFDAYAELMMLSLTALLRLLPLFHAAAIALRRHAAFSPLMPPAPCCRFDMLSAAVIFAAAPLRCCCYASFADAMRCLCRYASRYYAITPFAVAAAVAADMLLLFDATR